ncbi:TatD family hydrolase [soil metagenome]
MLNTLTDSHCHLDRLDLSSHEGKLQNALEAANAQGVTQILCVCVELATFPTILAIAESYPNIHASVGLHPTEQVVPEPTVEELIKLGSHSKVVALGETGLDYYHCEGDLTWQQQRFRNHIAAAKALKKPIIVHTRNAQKDTIRILQEEKAHEVGGVMHCFTEDWDMAQEALALNFYISFSGIVTFNSAKTLQEVAKLVPLERMLIETDAPYLAPVPHRGKSNEPAYVRFVAEKIAQLRNISVEEVAKHTTENYEKLFIKRV